MDLVLLAITALGALGVYFLLPRGKASWVKLGGLLVTAGMAGFFLYLLRHGAKENPGQPGLFFYAFASIMIAGSLGVICQPKPVYAALYFVLVTLAGAGLFILLLAEFMSIVLIIVYAGAILVTYVFVIMLASQGTAHPMAYDRHSAEPFAAVLASFVLLGAILQMMFPAGKTLEPSRPEASMVRSLTENAKDDGKPVLSNVQVLGKSLYEDYLVPLELTGVLLTIALVGAVVIARKETENEPAAGGLPVE